MNLMIDTLGYAEALEQSGFTSEQAKGAAKALNNTVGEELATKADLAQLGTELRSEIAESRAELHTEINKVRSEIAEARTELSAELHAEINKVRTEIAESRAELRTEIAQLGTELRSELNTQINKVQTEIAETRAEIAGLRAEAKGDIKLVHWTLGIVVVAVVIPLVRDFLL